MHPKSAHVCFNHVHMTSNTSTLPSNFNITTSLHSQSPKHSMTMESKTNGYLTINSVLRANSHSNHWSLIYEDAAVQAQ